MSVAQQFEGAYSQVQVIIFYLHNRAFGIEISKVREVAKRVDVTVINDPEGFIRGVVNLRGQIVMVADLAKCLGLPKLEDVYEAAWMVFIKINEKTLGLIVDQVLDVVEVPVSRNSEGGMFIQQVKGMGIEGEESIALLEVEKIFSDL